MKRGWTPRLELAWQQLVSHVHFPWFSRFLALEYPPLHRDHRYGSANWTHERQATRVLLPYIQQNLVRGDYRQASSTKQRTKYSIDLDWYLQHNILRQ